jgi:cyclase
MLKKRIIAVLPILGGRVVQSISFNQFLPIGSPEVCAEAVNMWGADELMLLDIHASKHKLKPDPDLVKKVANYVSIPLTYGGGITTTDEMVELINSGADKITINTSALNNPTLITQASLILGKQCVIVSMDIKETQNGCYEVFNSSDMIGTGMSPEVWAHNAENLGAGEILINTIHRDGSGTGFDLVLLELMLKSVSIPIILMGGAGHPSHFFECFRHGADAAAAGNYFQFTEHSIITTKAYLKHHGIQIRMDTPATYDNVQFNETGRVAKFSDAYLKELKYSVIKKEVI